MIAGTHLYTWVKRGNVDKSFLSKETTRWQWPGSNHRPLDRKSNALTTRPPRLHKNLEREYKLPYFLLKAMRKRREYHESRDWFAMIYNRQLVVKLITWKALSFFGFWLGDAKS